VVSLLSDAYLRFFCKRDVRHSKHWRNMPPRDMSSRSAGGKPANEARGGAAGALTMCLKVVCQSSPGLALFAVWCVGFALVAWGTQHVARTCEANGEVRGNAFSERDQARSLKSTD